MEAATTLQSLWRGRSVRHGINRSCSASDTRKLLPASGSGILRDKPECVPVLVAPAEVADAANAQPANADGIALVDASNYASAHDLLRLTAGSVADAGIAAGQKILRHHGAEDLARRRLQLRSLAMVAMSGVLFALQGASVKLASREPGGGTFEMVTARGLVQLVGVLASNAWLHARGEHPLPVRHWMGVTWIQRKWLVLRALLGFAGIGFGFGALRRIPLGDSSALSFISPSVSVLVAWLTLGEAAGRAELLGIGGATAGVVLVARPPMLFGAPDGETAPPTDQLGVAFALAGAVSAGSVVVIIRKLAQKLHWSAVLLYQAVGQALLAPLCALILGEALMSPGRRLLLLMAGGGSLAFVAQVLMTKGLAAARVGPSSTMRSTSVLTSYVLQASLTPDEPVAPLSLCGALVITASICLILLHKAREMPPPAR